MKPEIEAAIYEIAELRQRHRDRRELNRIAVVKAVAERRLTRQASSLEKELQRRERSRLAKIEQNLALKVAGGDAYEQWKAIQRAKSRERRLRDWRKSVVYSACKRGEKMGLGGTITVDDIIWPTHCPVLGIELVYPEKGCGHAYKFNRPSLDRWDNTRGYIPGNVFVISMRANSLKSNATAAELQAVALYARKRPDHAAPTLGLHIVQSSVRTA